MRFLLLSDNIDTKMGMRLAGVEGIVVHEREEVISALKQAIKQKDVAVILITAKAVRTCPNVVAKYKMEQHNVLIVEIPDRHGGDSINEMMDQYVKDAIGVTM